MRLSIAACLLGATVCLSLSALSQPARGDEPGSDWPQWRGPNRNGISPATGLLKEWPKDGPPVAWSVKHAGVGYSSAAIKDGRVFTQGDIDGVEHVIAMSLKDGRRLWAVQPAPVAALLVKRISEDKKRADRNKDGMIDEAEALDRFGWRFASYDRSQPEADVEKTAQARVDRLMNAYDANGDGVLTVQETRPRFWERFAAIDREDKQADAAQLATVRAQGILEAYDQDKDGRLSRREAGRSPLNRSFRQADRRDPDTKQGDNQLTLEEIRTYFRERQTGKDGKLTASELKDYYMKRHPRADGILSDDELRGALGGYRNGMGNGPRGTPTVEADRVYVEGGNGDVTCLQAETGKTIWHVNLRSDFKGGLPGWGYSESPLIEGDLVIVTPGGNQGTLAALNKMTGKEVWRSGEVTERAHYASPIAHTMHGIRQIIQFGRQSVFAVAAKDGRFLWRYAAPANGTANCATPLAYENYVFGSSSYGKGGGLAKIVESDGEFSAEEVYFEKRMANHHGGLVLHEGHIYGFGSGGLICMELLTGKIKWRARSVSKGSLLLADGMLYLLGEGHQVALAEATPEEYRERGRFKIERYGRPSWAHPALADGKLLIRNQASMTAYDIRK